MLPGEQYVFKQTTRTASGSITTLRYRIDVNTLHREPAPELKLNEIGRCAVSLSQPIAFDGYRRNRATGAFVVIDRITNVTVGAGMILDRATAEDRHDHWDDSPAAATLERQASAVSQEERAARFGQQPATLLLTGLTGSGKSTLAAAVERRLFDAGRACGVLDGQNLRLGISKDLGFSVEDRSENLRRGAEIAKLLNQSGLIAVCAFVAPQESFRSKAGRVVGEDRFLVVHLSAPAEVCRTRGNEELYAKAEAGEVDLPGVSAEYEPPAAADLVLPTHEWPVEKCVDAIIELLQDRGVIQ